MCVCVCMISLGMYVCVGENVARCIYMRTYIHHTYTHTSTYTHTHTHTHIHTLIHSHKHTPPHTHIHSLTHKQLSNPLGIMIGYGCGIATSGQVYTLDGEKGAWRLIFIVQGILLMGLSLAFAFIPRKYVQVYDTEAEVQGKRKSLAITVTGNARVCVCEWSVECIIYVSYPLHYTTHYYALYTTPHTHIPHHTHTTHSIPHPTTHTHTTHSIPHPTTHTHTTHSIPHPTTHTHTTPHHTTHTHTTTQAQSSSPTHKPHPKHPSTQQTLRCQWAKSHSTIRTTREGKMVPTCVCVCVCVCCTGMVVVYAVPIQSILSVTRGGERVLIYVCVCVVGCTMIVCVCCMLNRYCWCQWTNALLTMKEREERTVPACVCVCCQVLYRYCECVCVCCIGIVIVYAVYI
jgi:hypothetical protein